MVGETGRTQACQRRNREGELDEGGFLMSMWFLGFLFSWYGWIVWYSRKRKEQNRRRWDELHIRLLEIRLDIHRNQYERAAERYEHISPRDWQLHNREYMLEVLRQLSVGPEKPEKVNWQREGF